MAAKNNAHPNCHKFVEAVEELLERRLNERRLNNRTDIGKKFPFYIDIRRGKTQSLPICEEVGRIADYLLCTLPERNRLLLEARCPLKSEYITGSLLQNALETAKRIIDDLPFPAFAVTRDDTMHYWNEIGLRLFNTSKEEEDSKRPLLEQRNILRYIFDPSTPVYDVFTNWRRNFAWHRYTCRLNVLRFKQNNVLCQHDEWYKKRVESLMDLPTFENIWNTIQIDTGIEEIRKDMPSGMLIPEYATHIYRPDGRDFRIRGLQIDYTGWGYPQIIVYTYDDKKARDIFEELGIPTSDNRWSQR